MKNDNQFTSEYLPEVDPLKERNQLIAPRSAREAFGSSYFPPPKEKFPWFILPIGLIALFFLWGVSE